MSDPTAPQSVVPRSAAVSAPASGSRVYPSDFTDAEIREHIAAVSANMQLPDAYPIIDDLVRQAVLFNLGYAELQNRQLDRLNRKIYRLTLASVAVAVASLVAAIVAVVR